MISLRNRSDKKPSEQEFRQYVENKIKIRKDLKTKLTLPETEFLRQSFAFENDLVVMKKAMENIIKYELSWYEFDESLYALIEQCKAHYGNDTRALFTYLSGQLHCGVPEKMLQFYLSQEKEFLEERLKAVKDMSVPTSILPLPFSIPETFNAPNAPITGNLVPTISASGTLTLDPNIERPA